ncbi:stalk domain-containing protein [Paenibacillus tyrfis]|uniref:stalk domain-containing protein n=1 Tax=Paenibacillus tyrfis TaxID=1501230 RepID=UPI00209E29D0|nr:stalk domain-containing protein [Paenibacillus tyrfis]MCP1306116.1 copper amine oxidase N-terminal domain-containing protein [Paenibacillus tyrfis]
MNKKKFIIVLTTMGVLSGLTTGVLAADSIRALLFPVTYKFNDQVKELGKEYITLNYEGHVYVPLRFVAENMGGAVAYEESTGTVYVKNKGTLDIKNITSTSDSVNLGNLILTKEEGNKTKVSGSLEMLYGSDDIDSVLKFFNEKNEEIGHVDIKGNFKEGLNNFEATGDGDFRSYSSVKYSVSRIGKMVLPRVPKP